jgi:DNA primase
MANPGDFAYTLKQQADIVRIIGEYVRLKRAGAQNYSGLCPFHGEKTPSFSVHASRQFFHCFGCGESGDVYKFLQRIENISFPESVRLLAQKLGVPMPKVQFDSPAEAREAKLRGILVDLHEAACRFFQERLKRPEAAHAREYLKGRGLDEEALARFRIGYAPESGFLLRDAVREMADQELLRESGLFSQAARDSAPPRESSAAAASSAPKQPDREAQPSTLYSKFRNRVMFPICNEQGKVIAFTGRTLAADEKSGPKYLNSPETAIYHKSRVLYNLHLAKEAIRQLDYALLVEGQMDCISVYNAGCHNVIASSGTAFTEIQAKLLSRFSKKIVVNFDPDTAGAAAAERSLGLLIGEDFEIRVLTLDQGFDPDLYIRRKGADAYKQALAHSQKYFDYLIERARKQFPAHTSEGKVKAVNYLLPHIQRVASRIARDEIAAEVAQKLQIDSAVLRQELHHVAGARQTTRVSAPTATGLTEAEPILIRALAGGAGLGQQQAEVSTTSTFTRGATAVSSRQGDDPEFDPQRQVRFVLASERLHEGLASEGLIDALMRAVSEGTDPMSLELADGERRMMAAALMDEHELLTPESLHAALEALRRRKLEHRRRELRSLIADAERAQDSISLGELLREKTNIDKLLRPGQDALNP